MSIEVHILTHDTTQRIGLKYILMEYFNIPSKTSTQLNIQQLGENPTSLFFVSTQCYIEYQDFFFPRKNRTIIISKSPIKDSLSIDVFSPESEIINQISSILESFDSSTDNTTSELSPREIDVLKLIAMGLINKEIADKLAISINTVLTHRKNISSKLGIKSVSALSIYAIMNGYISEKDLMR